MLALTGRVFSPSSVRPTPSAGGYELAQQMLGEALNIASQLSDPKLMAGLLGARSIVNYHFLRLREAAADGLRSEQSGGSGNCSVGSRCSIASSISDIATVLDVLKRRRESEMNWNLWRRRSANPTRTRAASSREPDQIWPSTRSCRTRNRHPGGARSPNQRCPVFLLGRSSPRYS